MTTADIFIVLVASGTTSWVFVVCAVEWFSWCVVECGVAYVTFVAWRSWLSCGMCCKMVLVMLESCVAYVAWRFCLVDLCGLCFYDILCLSYVMGLTIVLLIVVLC